MNVMNQLFCVLFYKGIELSHSAEGVDSVMQSKDSLCYIHRPAF